MFITEIILILMIIISFFISFSTNIFFVPVSLIIVYIFYKIGIINGVIEEIKNYEITSSYDKRKKEKLIIYFIFISITIVFIFLFNIFVYFNKVSLVNDKEIYKNYAGWYHSDSWKEYSSTIILQSNNSCAFFNNKTVHCRWKIIKDEIHIYVYNINSTKIQKKYTGIIDNDSFSINNHLFKKFDD